MITVNKVDLLKIVFIILSGAAAGFISGFLGAGGGIVLIFALNFVMKEKGDVARDNFATSLAAVTVYSMMSAAMYQGNGQLAPDRALVFLLPAAIGGIIGALLLDKINTKWLKRIFALLVIYAGINMI
ncbi:MAG: sulfite exporter TauE/SafE family protein [Clostridiales bacterium]|nr:sulfite exporter TauE/SafE family protein [Clostridiales bacterium]